MGNCLPPGGADKESSDCSDKCRTFNGKNICPPETKCEETRDCQSGFICSDKKCKILECILHEHCPRAEDICMFGTCVSRSKLISCTPSKPCPSQFTCLGSVCMSYTFCNDDSHCPQPHYRCETLFVSRYQRGICIPMIKCNSEVQNENGIFRNGCPINMQCNTNGACETQICDISTDCGWGLKCKELKTASEKVICFPEVMCRRISDCDENQKCDLTTGSCLNLNCDKCTSNQFCEKGACVDRHTCEPRRCPPRHVCKSGECTRDVAGCMTDSDCDDGKVCWLGYCVVEPPCSEGNCTQGQICHGQLKICVSGCDKDPALCKTEETCDPNAKTCIAKYQCITDYNCPVDMICRYKDQACSGQKGCTCIPREDCKCSRGGCIADTKICSVTRGTCAECPPNTVCPKFSKTEDTKRCVSICEPRNPFSCPSNHICLVDLNGAFVCVPKPSCKKEVCIPPLRCVSDSCELPECLTDDDCGLFQMCYSNQCQTMPIICTNDRHCKRSTCVINKKASIGVCADCNGKCSDQMCKNGFCEFPIKCEGPSHCDEYHTCNVTCAPKPCENCEGKLQFLV